MADFFIRRPIVAIVLSLVLLFVEILKSTRSSNASVADHMLSTGVFILGPEAGMALIERLPDVEGVIVSDQNVTMVSSGLRGRLRVVDESTVVSR